MKKIVYLISGLLLSSCAMSQQITSSLVVNTAFPKGTQQINGQQLHNFVKINYKVSQVPENKPNTYLADGLIISFWDLSVDPQLKKSLVATKSEALGYLNNNKNNVINDAKIVTINNKQFLIIEIQKKDEIFLRFQSDFDSNNKNICGLIQCKEPNKEKARSILQNLLVNMKFKEVIN